MASSEGILVFWASVHCASCLCPEPLNIHQKVVIDIPTSTAAATSSCNKNNMHLQQLYDHIPNIIWNTPRQYTHTYTHRSLFLTLLYCDFCVYVLRFKNVRLPISLIPRYIHYTVYTKLNKYDLSVNREYFLQKRFEWTQSYV